ncbi:hypothetical protein R3Q15_09405 [Gordonia amicalis]|uniref:Uncharacterized protein n=2 Tax=Gordonia amicalis TaxID=89053 RepID=A0AAE4R2E7_9ACTN|nr:hypothetical protein [Gordonia amicalis]
MDENEDFEIEQTSMTDDVEAAHEDGVAKAPPLEAVLSPLLFEVVQLSEARTFTLARHEWRVGNYRLLEEPSGVCVCTKTGLIHLYEIYNVKTGATLEPIGSECIKMFGEDRMLEEAAQLRELVQLQKIAVDRVPLDLKGHFSKRVLAGLFLHGAFQPCYANGYDAERDYEFLLGQFNKRSKPALEEIRRVDAILRRGNNSVRAWLLRRAEEYGDSIEAPFLEKGGAA